MMLETASGAMGVKPSEYWFLSRDTANTTKKRRGVEWRAKFVCLDDYQVCIRWMDRRC